MKIKFTVTAEYTPNPTLYPPDATKDEILDYEQKAVEEDPGCLSDLTNFKVTAEEI